jgi:two-component sensor histidine kinase
VFIVDVFAYALLCVLTFVRRLPYRARAGVFVFLTYGLGTLLLYTIGSDSASLLWLAAPPLLSVLLLRPGGVAAVLLLTLASIAVTTVQLVRDALPWTLPVSVWFTLLANYVALTAVIVAATSFLLDRLALVIEREKRLNEEKGTLIAENHHRVKNNLQLMASLLHLQAGSSEQEEARTAVLTSEARVRSMGLVHEAMFRQQDQRGIDMAALLPGFVDELVSVFGDAASCVETQIEPKQLVLSVERAIPFGLVLQELLSFAIRPGNGGESGRVVVRLREVDGQVELTVDQVPTGRRRERAVGQSPDVDVAQALVRQLAGELTWDPAHEGLRATVRAELGTLASHPTGSPSQN